MKEKKYDASSIQVLTNIEHIRAKPGFVVGGNNEVGLRVILKEILDNSFDEALVGHASTVTVILDEDCCGATVIDDGRGIPLEKHPKTKISTLATVFANSGAGAKFNNESYGASGGTNGIGSTAVNALSETFQAWSYRGRQQGYAEFKRGKLTGKDAVISKNDSGIKHGTKVHFRPDFEQIFKDVAPYKAVDIKSQLEDTAGLLPGIKIQFQETPAATIEVFDNSSGLGGLLAKYAGENLLFAPIIKDVEFVATSRSLDLAGGESVAKAEFAIGWRKSTEGQPLIRSYANLTYNGDGGTHQNSFERAIAGYFVERSGNKCSAKEVMEGLVGIIHLKHPDPQFSSQTKDKLINTDVAKRLQEAIEPAIKSWTRSHAAEVDAWLAKCVERFEYRQRERDEKSALKDLKSGQRKRGIMPAKLFEAKCRADQRELFIVEGDSAAGSAADGRDASYQEVLPLKGKILNVLRAPLAEALANPEITAIIAAIGGGIGDDFDLGKCRVSKVLLLADGDHDGSHISALVVSVLARFMKPLLEAGRVYVVDAPLFRAAIPNSQKRFYAHSIEELKKKAGKEFSKCEIGRLKGHGEADSKEVAEYALKPETRKLIRLSFNEEDLKQIGLLMSDDVGTRKELLGV